ncbi:hypothetical protein HBB16_15020 [Pseudonocardia sp. MCCB 268]|nr:hypothetical protein [Pseudonocardia cytotoxica]
MGRRPGPRRFLQAVVAVSSRRGEEAGLLSPARDGDRGAAAVAVYPLAFYSSIRLAGVAVGTVVSLGSAPIASGVLERVIDRRRRSAPGGCSRWRWGSPVVRSAVRPRRCTTRRPTRSARSPVWGLSSLVAGDGPYCSPGCPPPHGPRGQAQGRDRRGLPS